MENLHLEKLIAFKKRFWEHEYTRFETPALNKYYDQNADRLIQNAIQLRKEVPVETNILLTHLYKSDFSFKLVANIMKFGKEKKCLNLEEKITILNNAFEHGYHHFALLTICDKYQPGYIATLHKNWFIPDKAREWSEDLTLQPWTNKAGNFIAGKKWILENCPLHNLITAAGNDVDLLTQLKNGKSHEKLTVVKDGVIIFTSKGWFTPALIINDPVKFNFTKIPVINFERLKGIQKENRKSRTTGDIFSKESSYMAFWVCEYFFNSIWDKIQADESLINQFLHSYGFKLDIVKFKELYEKMLRETYEAILLLRKKLNELIPSGSSKNPDDDAYADSSQRPDFEPLLRDCMSLLNEIRRQTGVDNKLSAFMHVGFGFVLSMTAVAENLHQSMDAAICKENAV